MMLLPARSLPLYSCREALAGLPTRASYGFDYIYSQKPRGCSTSVPRGKTTKLAGPESSEQRCRKPGRGADCPGQGHRAVLVCPCHWSPRPGRQGLLLAGHGCHRPRDADGHQTCRKRPCAIACPPRPAKGRTRWRPSSAPPPSRPPASPGYSHGGRLPPVR